MAKPQQQSIRTGSNIVLSSKALISPGVSIYGNSASSSNMANSSGSVGYGNNVKTAPAPKNWEFHTNDEYDSQFFNGMEPVHCALASTWTTIMQYHLAVWKEQTKPHEGSYRVMKTVHSIGGRNDNFVLLFDTASNQQAFIAWFNDYEAKFGNDSVCTEVAPSKFPGNFISGFGVNGPAVDRRAEYDYGMGYEEIFIEWNWILTNTSGDAKRIGGLWIFSNQDEAVQFKLTFPTET